jgi:hypothetical protein
MTAVAGHSVVICSAVESQRFCNACIHWLQEGLSSPTSFPSLICCTPFASPATAPDAVMDAMALHGWEKLQGEPAGLGIGVSARWPACCTGGAVITQTASRHLVKTNKAISLRVCPWLSGGMGGMGTFAFMCMRQLALLWGPPMLHKCLQTRHSRSTSDSRKQKAFDTTGTRTQV